MKKIFIIIFLCRLFSPSPVATPTEKGIDAFSAGKYDDALSQFGKAAKDNPDKAEAHINLGDALYKKGEFDKAAKEYSEAARLKPNMPEAWYNMGDALYKMGAYDKALIGLPEGGFFKKGSGHEAQYRSDDGEGEEGAGQKKRGRPPGKKRRAGEAG